METIEKILIAKNDNNIQRDLQDLKMKISYFQNFVNQYKNLGLKELDKTDLVPLFNNPKSFITNQITKGESLKVGGLNLSSEKLFDLIEKPIGTDELIELILKDTPNYEMHRDYIAYINDFEIINDSSKVEVSKETIERITFNNSIFADTPKKLEVWEQMQKTSKALNDLRLSFKTSGVELHEKTLKNMFGFKNEFDRIEDSFEFTPNARYINQII